MTDNKDLDDEALFSKDQYIPLFPLFPGPDVKEEPDPALAPVTGPKTGPADDESREDHEPPKQKEADNNNGNTQDD